MSNVYRSNPLLKKTPERVREELEGIFNQPFPIRGWMFSVTRNPIPEQHVYQFHYCKPETDEYRALLEGFQPVQGEILATHLHIEARFKITQQVHLLGQTVTMTPDGVDKQLCTINCPNLFGGISVIVMAGNARHYSAEGIHPDGGHFSSVAEEWTNLYLKSEEGSSEHERARYVLGELNAIQKNAQGALHTMFSQLGSQIAQYEPDYWTWIEKLLRERANPDEVMKACNGVVKVEMLPSALRVDLSAKLRTVN